MSLSGSCCSGYLAFCEGSAQTTGLYCWISRSWQSAYIRSLRKLAPKRFEVTGDMSILQRLILWDVAWRLFQSSPVHGVGFGIVPSGL